MFAPATCINRVNIVDHRLLRTDVIGAVFSAVRRKQLRPAAFHKPADRVLGKRGANGGCRRQGVQNIAHGAETNDQDFRHYCLLSNSVVEWSLGSPTMATRPPQAITTSRSGTLSAV